MTRAMRRQRRMYVNVMIAGSRRAPLANCWVRKPVSRENQTTEEKAAPECTPPYS